MVPPCSDRVSRAPSYSISPINCFRVRGYHPVSHDFPDTSTSKKIGLRAAPRSLVATEGISVDFCSSGYLDISVPQVSLHTLCIQVWIPHKCGGFPHSEIPGSKSVCRLPEAYRRLQRPSSPSAAKASTRCTFMLDHIIQCIVADPLCSDHALQHGLSADVWFIQSSYLFIINNVL